MLDETRAKFLQDVYYISNQNSLILGLLQEEVRTIAHILFHIHARKTKYYADFTDHAWKASTRFIEMYLKYPNWKCKSFRNRVYLEVKYQLYNPKVQRDDAIKWAPLEDAIILEKKEEDEDTRWVLEDLKSSQPDLYSTILFDCYKSRTYKSFILKLSTYTSKRFIYDNAKKLNYLYKYTRRR
jgi:hypothetical protein